MLDTLEYLTVDGPDGSRDITVYALSTCGFCKRAMAFLEGRGLRYRYVYMDKIPFETKTEAKKTLKERWKMDVAFPFAVVDDAEALVGFIEPDWKRVFDQES
ncbi:MAG: hypothetical protein JXA15_00780 [Spirochaetales bacterium]|nr:hypothetical protein [Spirochaetales bacterium]